MSRKKAGSTTKTMKQKIAGSRSRNKEQEGIGRRKIGGNITRTRKMGRSKTWTRNMEQNSREQ